MKKILTGIGLVATLAITLTFSVHADYSDIDNRHPYFNAVEFMTQQGVIQGNPDGSYQPEKNLNRAELLKILIEAKFKNELNDYKDKDCFPDVPKNEWYQPHVCLAKAKGIVQGYSDNTFRPSRSVNFVEAMKMTMKTYNYQYDEDREIWYEDLVQKAGEKKLIPVDVNEFGSELNRGQMADMITRVVKEESDQLENYLTLQSEFFELEESPLLNQLKPLDPLASEITFDKNQSDKDMKAGHLIFETSQKYPDCYGLTSHNKMDEKRINVVFAPAGYDSFKPVNEIVEGMIDYDGKGNGMFSFEPYKSMKNKFNFWVTKDIFYEADHQTFLNNQQYHLDRQGVRLMANKRCPLDNVVLVSPIRYPNCTVAHAGDKSIWMSIEEDGAHPYFADLVTDQQLDPNVNRQYDYDYLSGKTLLELRHAPVFAHELGHVFGLRDEYVNFETLNTPVTSDIKSSSGPNCFVGTYDQCLKSAPWKSFIDTDTANCYEGCHYHGEGIFRPTPRSLMNAVEGMYYLEPDVNSGDYKYFSEDITYGAYNESLIKKAIDQMTQ